MHLTNNNKNRETNIRSILRDRLSTIFNRWTAFDFEGNWNLHSHSDVEMVCGSLRVGRNCLDAVMWTIVYPRCHFLRTLWQERRFFSLEYPAVNGKIANFKDMTYKIGEMSHTIEHKFCWYIFPLFSCDGERKNNSRNYYCKINWRMKKAKVGSLSTWRNTHHFNRWNGVLFLFSYLLHQ